MTWQTHRAKGACRFRRLDASNSRLTKCHVTRTWRDERVFPAYVAAASFVVLAIQGVLCSKLAQRWLFKKSDTSDAVLEQPSSWLRKRGNATIFAYKFARLLTLIVFLNLNVVTALRVSCCWYNIAQVLTSVSIILSSLTAR